MNHKEIIEWIKEKISINHLLIGLYAILSVETITVLGLEENLLGLLLGVTLIIAIIIQLIATREERQIRRWIRKRKKYEKKLKDKDVDPSKFFFIDKELEEGEPNWNYIRYELKKVLVKNKILMEKAIDLKTTDSIEIVDSQDKIEDGIAEQEQKLIHDLREIGLDGILTLLFLMKQEPAMASARVIKNALNIPTTTLYRLLKKLSNNEMVTVNYITNNPKKGFYSATDIGSSIIVDLYELLGGSML